MDSVLLNGSFGALQTAQDCKFGRTCFAGGIMSAAADRTPASCFFDDTLTVCAGCAAQSLADPASWQSLHGRDKECYQRLLTLVSKVDTSHGVDSIVVWEDVVDYVARCQQSDNAKTMAVKVADSAPFALSTVAAQVQATATVLSPFQAQSSASHHQPSGKKFKPQLEQPPSKQQKSQPGPMVSSQHTPAGVPTVRASYTMPFGCISTPHQLMLDMELRSQHRAANDIASLSQARTETSGGAQSLV